MSSQVSCSVVFIYSNRIYDDLERGKSKKHAYEAFEGTYSLMLYIYIYIYISDTIFVFSYMSYYLSY